MKAFLNTCLVFFLFLVPLYLTSLVIVYHSNTAKYIPNVLDKTKNDGFLLSRLRELPNYKNIDFLFLGSSHACREFDPRIFKQNGYTSFNLGSSGQTPLNSEFLLKKYIDSVKPKHLVFELYFLFFANDGIESSTDILANSEIDYFNLSRALSRPNLKIYNTISSILINRVFEPLHKIKENYLKTDIYVSGGYIEKILPDSINRRLSISPTSKELNIRQDQLNALTRIIKLAAFKGVKVTLVSAPVTEELLRQYKNYNTFHEQIQKIAEIHEVQYIDYNYNSNLEFNSYTDFYDSNHLTQKGVKKFNTDLIEKYLSEEYK